MNASQVPLFVTVGSPTNEPLSGTGMAPGVGNNKVLRTEGGGPCQRPALSSTRMETIPDIIIEAVKSDLNEKKSQRVEITVVATCIEIQPRHFLRPFLTFLHVDAYELRETS